MDDQNLDGVEFNHIDEPSVVDDRYGAAVDALRATMDEYEQDSQIIAASAAEIIVKELDKEDSFLLGINREDTAKALFVAATAMVLIRDRMVEDADHLLEVDEEDGQCEDEDCEYSHDGVDPDRVVAVIDGFECGVAATVGMALAMVDMAVSADPDNFDWSGTSGGPVGSTE